MIEREQIEQLKEIFVPRQECQATINSIDEKLSHNDVRLSVIENQLKLITWLLTAVGGGVITMLIKTFLGG